MAESTMTPRKEQAAKTRQEIFDTAIELFDRKGYEKVSINEICKKAGVSTGAFLPPLQSQRPDPHGGIPEGRRFLPGAAEDVAGMEDHREKIARVYYLHHEISWRTWG